MLLASKVPVCFLRFVERENFIHDRLQASGADCAVHIVEPSNALVSTSSHTNNEHALPDGADEDAAEDARCGHDLTWDMRNIRGL